MIASKIGYHGNRLYLTTLVIKKRTVRLKKIDEIELNNNESNPNFSYPKVKKTTSNNQVQSELNSSCL